MMLWKHNDLVGGWGRWQNFRCLFWLDENHLHLHHHRSGLFARVMDEDGHHLLDNDDSLPCDMLLEWLFWFFAMEAQNKCHPRRKCEPNSLSAWEELRSFSFSSVTEKEKLLDGSGEAKNSCLYSKIHSLLGSMHQSYEFSALLRLWKSGASPASWHFVTVPKTVSEQIKQFASTQPKKWWWSVCVEVRIWFYTRQTSVFPDKASGCYLLPIKAQVRKALQIGVDDEVRVTLTVL